MHRCMGEVMCEEEDTHVVPDADASKQLRGLGGVLERAKGDTEERREHEEGNEPTEPDDQSAKVPILNGG